MSWKIILWIMSVLIFWGYALWYLIKWGVPYSWSITFYELKEKYKKNTGYVLSLVLFGTLFPMLPLVMDKHPLMFPALAAIGFIAAAPAYRKSKMELTVHMVGSIASVTIALLAFAFSYKLYIPAAIMAAAIILMYTKVLKIKNYITLIESMVIAAGHIIILLKDIIK